MRCHALIIAAALAAFPAFGTPLPEAGSTAPKVVVLTPGSDAVRPVQRPSYLPRARWDFRSDGHLWTRATMSALNGHGRPLLDLVPADIADWCPAYPENGPEKRAAFWNGFISALVKHESTYKPRAVGGGGKWYGLTQILPATARGYKCRVGTGAALKHGPSNLSCAVRIMAFTVNRDGVVAKKNGRLAGVSADWGPMHSRKKRSDMAAYTKRQKYCRLLSSVKPVPRPASIEAKRPLADRLSGIRPAQRPAPAAIPALYSTSNE